LAGLLDDQLLCQFAKFSRLPRTMRTAHASQQFRFELFRCERWKLGGVAVIRALLENEQIHDLYSVPVAAIAHEFLNVGFRLVGEFHSHGCIFRGITSQSTRHLDGGFNLVAKSRTEVAAHGTSGGR
jgi:hypothetical protein